MSFTTAVTRLSYNGDGITVTFTVPWLFYANTDLLVVLGGVIQALSSQYNVTGAGLGSGSVTFIAAPPVGSGNVQIILNDPITQVAEFVDGTAFPSETMNEALDRSVQISSRLQDQISRALRAPDGDQNPGLLLPPAAQRALQYQAYDANGNSVVVPSLPGSNFTAQSVGLVIYPQSQSEINAAVVPTNYVYVWGDVRRYGALGYGVDDTAAMVKACAVGQTVTVPFPMYCSSASLALLPNNAITLSSNTTIRTLGGGSISLLGSTPCNLFYSLNASNIDISGCLITGNGAGTSALGYLWYCKMDATAGADCTGFTFIGNTVSNFSGFYWVYFDNTAAVTCAMRDIRVQRNKWNSVPGNAQGPTDIQKTASCLGFSGSDTITSFSTMTDIDVSNNVANGAYIKSFVYFWSGVTRYQCNFNTLRSFCTDASFTNDTGGYAIAAYDHSHGAGLTPDTGVICGNTIQSVRDAGIYLAAPSNLTVAANLISGQTSTANVTLPKGGIASPGAKGLVLVGNRCEGCAIGITILNSPGYDATLNVNVISNFTNSGLIVGGTSAGAAPSIVVDGLVCRSSVVGSTGVIISASASVGITNFALRNFVIDTPFIGFMVLSNDLSVPALGNIHVANGEVRSVSNYGIQFSNCTNAAQRITIEGIVFNNPVSGAALLFMAGAPNLTIRNITFCDMTSGAGFCWYGGGATGTIEGVRYRNVATNLRFSGAANELGTAVPTFAGNDNDFIQDLNIFELGTTPNKYMRLSWTWDRVAAAWKENRALTGN